VAEWFRGYLQTYVERDVRQLFQIADLVAFRTLAQLAALRTGQVLATDGVKAIGPACGPSWSGRRRASPPCWLTTERKP
jgi:hypothetical protein